MRISDIIIGKRFRKDMGNLDSLKKSIQEVGLLHPIVLDEKNNLIAGARRIQAFKELGKNIIPVHVVPIQDLRKGEIDENVIRKNFLPDEIEDICNAVEADNPPGPKLCTESVHNSGRTTKIVASYVGIGRDKVDKLRSVVKAARKDPEKWGRTLQKMNQEVLSVAHAHTIIKQDQRVKD